MVNDSSENHRACMMEMQSDLDEMANCAREISIQETREIRQADEDIPVEEAGEMSAKMTNIMQEANNSPSDEVACKVLDAAAPKSSVAHISSTREGSSGERSRRPQSLISLREPKPATEVKPAKYRSSLAVDIDMHRVRKNRSSVSINIPPTASDAGSPDWMPPLSQSFNGSSCHLEISLFCEDMSIDVHGRRQASSAEDILLNSNRGKHIHHYVKNHTLIVG